MHTPTPFEDLPAEPATAEDDGAGRGQTRRPVLLYDADCRFCRFAARTVARLDREDRIAFLPFGDSDAAPLLADVPAGERTSSIHLVDPDGQRFSRGAALTRLITQLGTGAETSRAVATARLIGRAYEPIARNRGRLGRRVPDGEAPRRYP